MVDSEAQPRAIFVTNHKMPSSGMTYLSDQEVREWLEGWLWLWHPKNLVQSCGIPEINGPYDHDPPRPGHIYLVPPSTQAYLPTDWNERTREAGSLLFPQPPETPDAAGTPAWVASGTGILFQALGYGLVWLEAFCESQDHPQLLDRLAFAEKLRQALEQWNQSDDEGVRAHLQDAAALLIQARESVSSSGLFHLDLILGEFLDQANWAASVDDGLPIPRNLVVCAKTLTRWETTHSQGLEPLRILLDQGKLDVAGGLFEERDDPLKSVESQLWNLKYGCKLQKELLGQAPRVFARTRGGLHSLLPLILQRVGLRKALLISFDESPVPHYRSPVISWAGSDGKSVEALTRVPLPGDSPQTWFHMAYHMGRAVREDHAPTVVLTHKGPATHWFRVVAQLASLGPVMGRWLSLESYFQEATPAEYPGVIPWEEFSHDWLVDESSPNGLSEPGVHGGQPAVDPVSSRSTHFKSRRTVDAAFTLSAIHEILDRGEPSAEWIARRQDLTLAEDDLEKTGTGEGATKALGNAVGRLANRLLANAPDQKGLMVFNPCSFPRRVALETKEIEGSLETGGVVKAFQKDGDLSRLVLEVPSFGYTWIPRQGGPPKPPPRARLRLADETMVRNEFFEAEIDTATGAIRAFRDPKYRQNRLAHQLIYLPGSRMKLDSSEVTSSGPALGELICRGEITDEQGTTLARYTQRLRAWIGRPVLEISVTLEPIKPPTGYAWHSLYAARFSLPQGSSSLSRGTLGMVEETRHNRPLSPEFLEWKSGNSTVTLLTGGMPFTQRHGANHLDLILVPPGETGTKFDYGLCMDRNHPQQIALAFVSPAPVLTVEKGPPPSGPSAWLFHSDLANVLVGECRIVDRDPNTEGESHHPQMVIRMQECEGQYSVGELRCFRTPAHASTLDSDGYHAMSLSIHEDVVQLELPRREMNWVQLSW